MSKQCGAFFVFFKIVVPMFIKLRNFLLFDIPQCFCVFKSTGKARNQPLNSQCCHAVLTCVYHASLQQALQFEEVVFFVVRKSAVPLMALLYLLVAYYGKCKNKTKQNSALLPLSINMNACIFENCGLCSDLIVQSTLLLSLPYGRKWAFLPSPVENQLSYIEEAYSQNLGKKWEMKAKQIKEDHFKGCYGREQ